MYCYNCGAQNSDDTIFCSECGKKLKNETIANVVTNNVTTEKANKKKSKLPKIIIVLALLLIVAIVIVICVSLLAHPKLKLGKTTAEVSVNVSNSGGVVLVNDPASVIDGFTITLNPGTYDTSVNFDISTTEITGHTYGKEFTPITPLITIDNGHDFADRPMQVIIPIDIKEDEFAMGFYYDGDTGELEAIPYLDISSDQIILLTNHFSDIVVSKISIAELEKLTAKTNNKADSGFEPGVDDWQFVNYGSALAPGGHCAGQSLTMAWYYQEMHQGQSEPSLFGRYDNNGDDKTTGFWQDDSQSYRFASSVQYNIDWDSLEFHNYLNFSRTNQKRVFYAFSYAILVTGSPQFMGIYHYDSYGNIAGGHAIVAYKVEGNRIYVADPNYPGQKDRFCELGSDGFKPYSSGANAADISTNGGVLYTEMNFIACSALINYDIIEQGYLDMLSGVVGDKEFPASQFEVMTGYNINPATMSWSSSNVVSLDKDYNDALPTDMKNSTLIRITPLDKYLIYSIYINGSTTAEQNPIFNVLDGSIYFEVDLKNGENEIAFLVEQEINGYYSYVDFVDITINFSPNKKVAETTAANTTKKSSNKLIDQLPGEYQLTHIGGVGAPGSENTSIISEKYYIYANGTYTFHATRKDTDPVIMEGTWTLEGTEICFNNGPPYTFNGSTITLQGSYPWIYTAVQKYD